ncbi:TonB-dependent receptor [Sphingobium sp. PAMC28499]|jgi:outer membrane receptor protein involved in Fe transport|uniref:TonB-dependent receptor domain-containing protein n=1 Tax=Sphingobium sp. PAMC28499 TaxID=2565554 RepID=UPI00109E0820|nr:TonB-dependent receptor [Sphingobium sp. PAMC28499]QCB39380.1 TonB-dependent receptor [Sphingobium sp. PAMC28499]
MATPLKFAGLLLLSTALVAPAALAQEVPAPADATTSDPQAADPAAAAGRSTAEDPEAAPDISVPGSDIIVTGRRSANVQKNIPAVVSVLSSADIARTGDGNIAGALGRVTGLSVVGNGYVYVRGLGDRYSLALLNGSPLPSPEPLKRVVPLDLFPTNIVSSSMVQKSYSANYPGEFGGGVINLTTNAVPAESFLTVSGGIGANTETTYQMGYSYYGSKSDWTGFDNGSRDIPPALAAFFASGERISSGNVDTTAIAAEMVRFSKGTVQRIKDIDPNYSATISGGTSFDLGGSTLGLIATAGYSNKWTTRDQRQQNSITPDLSALNSDFQRVTTDNRIVVNGLLGLGLEFGDNKIRWTNLYIRDTLKHTRMGLGNTQTQPTSDIMEQDTAWYERQLIDTQVVGEFKLSPAFSLDVRGGFANSQREAPYELSFEYIRTNAAADPYGNLFVNRLNGNTGQTATVSFSDLNEDLWSGGADLTWKPSADMALTAGYAYVDTNRTSSRRDFQFRASSDMPEGVGVLRPDLLLAPGIVNAYDIALIETNEGNPAFRATLKNHAGYGKLNWQILDDLSLDAGVRYETAKLNVSPLQVFSTPGAGTASTQLDNNYWLPSGTLTWQMRDDMQVRLNASKTIARPQFRELIYQFYFDPDTNRRYQGNPYLQDSKLFNAEARYEWYFARDQRFTLSGFYKTIDNPIETFISLNSDAFITSFANAPKADLYGGEVELQKYFDLSSMSDSAFFSTRRLVTIANYTYTKSKLKVKEGDTTAVFGASSTLATDYFRNGSPLTGQSDHLVNFQFGLEDQDKLSQQTLILSYASKRVTSRGLANQDQPDVYEHPGINLDFVARQGVYVAGRQFDAKFEVRNILGNDYEESQSNGTNKVIYNAYNYGTTFNFSLSTTF